MDYQAIIDHYYPADGSRSGRELRDILLTHSTLVAKRAVKICDARPTLGMNRTFVWAAAMLHDIGIVRCNAPGIQCFGEEPYIRHGLAGAKMLMAYAAANGIGDDEMRPYARVCARHTGAGLTKEEIVGHDLPLPHEDFLPETMEEKVICYADKFYSKTHPDREKSFEEARKSLAKFSSDGLARFMAWQRLFEPTPNGGG